MPTKKATILLIHAALVFAGLIAFAPTFQNGFVNYDDHRYLTENSQVQSGLALGSIQWAFTTFHTNNWHPLTWLSHMLDHDLFGMDPFGHHLTSILIHIANSLLLFWVLWKMTGRVWPSAFAAALFSIHPLRVESVAWISERKDVLCAFFGLLAIWAYLRYVERRGLARYLLVMSAFLFGLMAKPMLVTLPFVLLLLDYWPLNRARFGAPKREDGPSPDSRPVRASVVLRLFMEKAPLFLLSALSCAITFYVQKSGGAVVQSGAIPLDIRIGNILVSYTRYLGNMFYPDQLAVYYPFPLEGWPVWRVFVSAILLVSVSVAVFYLARRKGFLLVGWLWYLGTLVPVIGLVQVGMQSMADRYTYIPSIGICIMVSWLCAEISTCDQRRYIVLGIGGLLILSFLTLGTRAQSRYWKNDSTLFEHTLAITEDNHITHNNYGYALIKNGRIKEAVIQFKKALEINPLYLNARKNIGNAYIAQERYYDAIPHLKAALRVKKDQPEVRRVLGLAYFRIGKTGNASTHLSEEGEMK